MTELAVVVGTAFALLLGWKISQLLRSPRDAPLRAVTLCLTSAAASFCLALPPLSGPIDSVGGHGAPRLVQNVFAFGMVFWLMCFYLYSATDHRRGRVRARWELLPLGLAVLGLSATTVAAAGRDGGGGYDSVDMRLGAVAAFYVIADLYLVYALAMALRWTWRYARAARQDLAVGLWLMAAALAVIAAVSAVRAVLTVVRWRGASVAPAVTTVSGHLIAAALPLFLIGAGYPAARGRLAVLRVRRQRRGMYHRLYPLWSLLHETYPQDALYPDHAGRAGLLRRPRGVHHLYYRRAIECRDGLVRISPYLGQPEAAATDLSDVSAEALADRLRDALRAQSEGREAPYGPIAVALPHAQGLDADVQQLVKLSDALTRRPAHHTGTRRTEDAPRGST
ncbi:MAB_1171c family putative transporter [Streptomyces sp. NPDC049954]|uniref:MAB_1171c family putative transporter n=1 Tax=Streptomyces sp. NPDC049954 TaxID=3155779 RepID=UPI00343BA97E